MMLHLGFELPPAPALDPDSEELTPFEALIIQRQIRKNARVIDSYVERLDLYVNREKYPNHEPFVERLRERMFLLMEENDTFRRLLARHFQSRSLRTPLSL